ncbi:MAG: methionyl-tRNA formyltransferase [Desulfuromonadaceae bacterium]|nr:methionyl-tRNA formyltransferase [Desulfuromonadaceae bacterium]
MIERKHMRVVFMGTPEFALPTLAGLIDGEVRIVGVFTQPDRPKGRGRKLEASPVKQLALEQGLPVFQPQRLREKDSIKQVRELRPELIVVVAYGQILPQEVLDIPKYGCINVHASLLPRHRGAAPINRAIIEGDPMAGVTTMLMDAGLDTGAMLVKRSLSVFPNEDAGQLHDRLAQLGRDAMDETLARLCSGTLNPEKQEDRCSTYAPMLKKEDGLIDWSRPAAAIHNQVRGLYPWPGAFTYLDGEVLKIADTRITQDGGEPGQILATDKCGVIVACGEGSVQIRKLQLPGKRMLAAADFVRGAKIQSGCNLG